ncbi:MAG: DEAD/DEAH box helicase [Proteobacteria bacterium]|nr:DEAD/DEAH box helicase [Pseudomonadota bacterium]
MQSFSELPLIQPLLSALAAEQYTKPTPIQARVIPLLLEGRDVVGCAQTGTGKTAAFALPILQLLSKSPRRPAPRTARALILAPTRELASQISDSFGRYGRELPLRRAVIFGGVGQRPQVDRMARGVDILVATPGRLLDLMNQGHVRLDGLELFVLDEADRMLDMGFIHDVKRIVAKLPEKRQTLLFSATMPDAIASLAKTLLKNPARVDVAPSATTVERVEQRVIFVDRQQKPALLLSVLAEPDVARVLVFTRTKHGADRVATQLERAGVSSGAIHGNKSQCARQKALADFRDGRARVLVATDIAARGIDVDGVTHVINFDIPNLPESYVHRIGRTARAGAAGIAISFCDHEERAFLRDIERTIRMTLAPMEGGEPQSNGRTAPAHPAFLTKPRTAGGWRQSRGGERGRTRPRHHAG